MSRAAVATVVRRFCGAEVRRVERVAGSIGNEDFLISTAGAGGFVLKASSGAALAAEAWACERVRREGVLAPEIVAVELVPSSLPMPFLLMRRFVGSPSGSRDDLLIAAGAQLRRVHAIGMDGFGELRIVDGDARGTSASWASYVEQILAALDRLVSAGVVSGSLAAAARRAVARSGVVEAAEAAGPSVLLHGDLKLQHIFGDRGRYVGIIDWGDASAGDPVFDLGRFSMVGAEALGRLLQGYGHVDVPDLERSLAGYRIVRNVYALTFEMDAGGDWFDVYRDAITAATLLLEDRH